MESDYTPMGSRSKIETFVESSPDFKKTVRYELSEKKEGSILLTDGSYLFGYIDEEEFEQLLQRKIELGDLSSRPAVLEFIDCDSIERNTKKFIHEESQSNLTKVAQAVDSKVSKFVPNKTKAAVTIVFVLAAALAAWILPSKFAAEPKGYDDSFYSSGMVQKKLINLDEKWVRFQLTEQTKNPKLAKHTALEIKQFNDEVDREKLTVEEKESLDKLYENATIYFNK